MVSKKRDRQIIRATLGFINNIIAEHMLLTLSPKILFTYEFIVGVIKGVITTVIAIIGGSVIVHFFMDYIIDFLIRLN